MNGGAPAEAQLKVELIRCINAAVATRYQTLQRAADVADVDYQRLWLVKQEQHQYLSVRWLFALAGRLGVRIRIQVDLAQ